MAFNMWKGNPPEISYWIIESNSKFNDLKDWFENRLKKYLNNLQGISTFCFYVICLSQGKWEEN